MTALAARPVALAIVALLALPLALAHAEPSPRIIQRVSEDVVFSVEFDERFAQTDVTLSGSGWFIAYSDGTHPSAPLERLRALGPGDAKVDAVVTARAPGHFGFTVAFPARGEWLLELLLASGERGLLPVTVYPDHPARLAWAVDAEDLFIQLEPALLAFSVEDAEPWSAAVARVEWWAADFSGPLAAFDLPLTVEANGTRVIGSHRFNEPGTYFIHVGSVERGLAPGDRPPFQIYVDSAAAPEVASAPSIPSPRETPGAAWISVLLVATGLALASAKKRK